MDVSSMLARIHFLTEVAQVVACWSFTLVMHVQSQFLRIKVHTISLCKSLKERNNRP
jgi:hypothetical protein